MDQADRLRALATFGRSSNAGRKIISITSGKGGVGKTNIAVNLATFYARRGQKTLLVDADLGLANANLLIGQTVVTRTMDDVMFHNAPLSSVFVSTDAGFDLLPGSSGVRKLLDLDAFAQRTLMDHLARAMEGYAVVIFDTAPGIGAHVLNFNALADEIVVVAHPEPTALTDAYALIKVLNEERRENRFRLLVNRSQNVHDGLEAYRRLTSVAGEFLNISVDYLGFLPEDAAVLKSVRSQKPVLLLSPRSSFALAIERVGDKLLASRGVVSTAKLHTVPKVVGLHCEGIVG